MVCNYFEFIRKLNRDVSNSNYVSDSRHSLRLLITLKVLSNIQFLIKLSIQLHEISFNSFQDKCIWGQVAIKQL